MTDTNRSLIAVLVLSACGFVGLAIDEGYTSKAIPDPVLGTKVPTIGFGTTEGVKMTDVTTPPQAMQRTLADVGKYEGAVKRCVHVPLHQYEYDAFINISYNIGGAAFCGSTIVKKVNALDYTGACNAILQWRYVGDVDCSAPGNKSCPGLWKRRLRLNSQCLGQTTGAQQ
jgi:lysozyme